VLLDVISSCSTGNAYILTAGADKLMLDCGVSWKRIQKALNFKLSDVVGCLITHEHT
jgi:glyoxylase-like metal-dependent hydrolase (beta-lactamase superfamily II)